MSLNYGRSLLAIPGPSVIPERVLAAMHRPSPNIYAGELLELTDSLYPDLKTVARTVSEVAIYIANGHGAWEAALSNTINRGDQVLVLATGRFAFNWGVLAQTLGVDTRVLDFGMQADVDLAKVEEVLKSDADGQIKAILVVQSDTASSVRNDISGLRQAIDRCGHGALFMVDCIASLACDPFEMDEWGVDVMVSACQKGLMTPAGLSFVYFNEKAASVREQASPSFYWDWKPRVHPELFYQQFAGTAPTHHLYGLREALDILVHEEGIDAAWKRHETIANGVWAALAAWNKEGGMHHNIDNPAKRTHAVSAITTRPGDAGKIRKWCEEEAGVTLGIGLGFPDPQSPELDQHFRIGHMGHQNIAMTMSVLGSIDAAMKALDIPHGNGALEAATDILARHPFTKVSK